MSDYLWNFPVTGLALALEGLDALRAELGLAPGTVPGNALGDRRDATGAIVTPLPADDVTKPAPDVTAWIGRPGSAADIAEGIVDGEIIEVPAKGDPDRYYMHIRTDRDAPGFDLAAYGLEPTDPATSAAVLGVWAGDDRARSTIQAGTGVTLLALPTPPSLACFADWATLVVTQGIPTLSVAWTATRTLVPGETLTLQYQWATMI